VGSGAGMAGWIVMAAETTKFCRSFLPDYSCHAGFPRPATGGREQPFAAII
jgi:hypothetical protein